MKTLNILIAFIFSISSIAVNAQAKTTASKKETVKVYGNCGMCKSRIEKAAKAAGATAASWSYDTQILSVSYTSSKTNLKNIEESVASVGHDTQHAKANNEAYNELHGCCKYERKANTDVAANASCCKDKDSCTKEGCCKPTTDADCCKAGSTSACCTSGKSCCSK